MYCISFTFTPKNVSATLNGGSNGQIIAFYNPSQNGCTSGTKTYQVEVVTSNASGNPTNRAFDLVVN